MSQRAGALKNLRGLASSEVLSAFRLGQWRRGFALLSELGIAIEPLTVRTSEWNRASDDFYEFVNTIQASSIPFASFLPSVSSSHQELGVSCVSEQFASRLL
jgi:hypothetical protein